MTDARLGYTTVEALVDIRAAARLGYTDVEVLWSTEDLTSVPAASLSITDELPPFAATLDFVAFTGTSTANRANGRTRHGSFIDESVEPVAPMPATLTRAQRVDKALAYPTPTLDDGRPT